MMPNFPKGSRKALSTVTSSAPLPVLVAALIAGSGLLGCSERTLAPADAQATSGGSASTPATAAVPLVSSLVGPAADGPAESTTTAPAPAPAEDTVAPAAAINGGPRGLATGAKGPAVAELEARLVALRFNPGKVDGAYDSQMSMAVMAFQKQQGMARTGRADPETLAKVVAAPLGAPMVATTEPSRVEIDLKRQIAQFWKDGKLLRVLAVSTGNGARYCVPKEKGGGCDTAITPGGSYRADRKIKGLRVSALGSLYDPVYFFGGIAIHGSPSIPPTPASHGCVRVPMWESAWVHNTVAIGDAVYVVGGKIAPVPFGEAAPTETPDEVTVPTTLTPA